MHVDIGDSSGGVGVGSGSEDNRSPSECGGKWCSRDILTGLKETTVCWSKRIPP